MSDCAKGGPARVAGGGRGRSSRKHRLAVLHALDRFERLRKGTSTAPRRRRRRRRSRASPAATPPSFRRPTSSSRLHGLSAVATPRHTAAAARRGGARRCFSSARGVCGCAARSGRGHRRRGARPRRDRARRAPFAAPVTRGVRDGRRCCAAVGESAARDRAGFGRLVRRPRRVGRCDFGRDGGLARDAALVGGLAGVGGPLRLRACTRARRSATDLAAFSAGILVRPSLSHRQPSAARRQRRRGAAELLGGVARSG